MQRNADNRRMMPTTRTAVLPRLRDVRVANVLLAAAVLSFFVGYLILNNQAATRGFAIRALEKRIADLEDQRRRLDLELVAAQSMGSISGRVKDLGFVPVEGVGFVGAAGGAVAVK